MNYSEFNFLSIIDKIELIDTQKIIYQLQDLGNKELNEFLKTCIIEEDNLFIKKSVLKFYTELVLVGKLKSRQILSFLIDEWPDNSDLHLQLQKLKDLVYFFDEEPEDIFNIYEKYINDQEKELSAEANHNLGIIYLKKAFTIGTEYDYHSNLKYSLKYFKVAYNSIENRIDSFIFMKIIEVLICIDELNFLQAKNYIQDLGNQLFQFKLYSFQELNNDLQYYLYKIILHLNNICLKSPNNWIDYKAEINKLYFEYKSILETNIKSRLSENKFLEIFKEHIQNKNFIPYIISNYTDQLYKLNILLEEYNSDSEEYQFLIDLKNLIENSPEKKKNLDLIKNKLTSILPNPKESNILDLINNSKDPNNLINIFSEFCKEDDEKLFDDIVYSCIKLQGEQKYSGSKANENDRNRYISNLIEAKGFSVKDQTQWSTSNSGKDSGEIDIMVTEKNGIPKSIIEALNLNSLQKEYTSMHLNKLFKYDKTGLKCNYIIIYYEGNNFNDFWKKYCVYIDKFTFEYEITKKEVLERPFSDIKIYLTTHLRNDKKTKLYHIAINVK